MENRHLSVSQDIPLQDYFTALYDICTQTFFPCVSMSGSLWFPDFTEYAKAHEIKKTAGQALSFLGDKEAKTRNPVLKTVRKI